VLLVLLVDVDCADASRGAGSSLGGTFRLAVTGNGIKSVYCQYFV
jgi:hypothetical protein